MNGQDLAAAAEALVGVPFRFQGRNPQIGLDCIGVLSAALEATGKPVSLPKTYTLRSHRIEGLNAIAARCSLRKAQGPVKPGDVLFVRVAACQHHLMLVSRGNKVVHAHAGLRRVILSEFPCDWPIVGHWRPTSTR